MTRKKEAPDKSAPEATIVAYKGFDGDFRCRGMQYAVGQTYTHEGAVIACKSGLHSCEYPLDVLGYYPPAGDDGRENRFATVEASGEIARHAEDSKVASARLSVRAEIGIPELVAAAVHWIMARIDHTAHEGGYQSAATNTGHRSSAATNTGHRSSAATNTGHRSSAATNTGDRSSAATNTGHRSAATNTGYQSAATNTGDRSAATNTGYQSAATNTGYQSAATNTSHRSAATNTGYQSAATNTGDQSAATNTGYESAATNTGHRSAATNTGHRSAATNTGYQSAATNTGDQSAATNTGDRSAATNTGYQSAATNTGDQSAATNTGDRSAASVTGAESVACALGKSGRARAASGGAIVLVYRDEAGSLIHVKAAKVGGDGVKPDTWYTLDATGTLVELANADHRRGRRTAVRLLTTPQLEAAVQDWQDGRLDEYLRSYDAAQAAHEAGVLLDGDDVTAEQVLAEYGSDDVAMRHHAALIRAAMDGERDRVAVHAHDLRQCVANIINERGSV